MQKRKFLTPQEVSLLLTTVLDGPNPERNHCLIMMAFLHGFRATDPATELAVQQCLVNVTVIPADIRATDKTVTARPRKPVHIQD
ncbi:hypothetical protein FHZ12_22435 [Salmonella enterica]|nr:hypothetical protein [Salmonella enterica]